VLKPLTDLTVKAIGMYGSGVAKSWRRCRIRSSRCNGSLDMARRAAGGQ
jgi:diacylglycerol O-acyltransferase